MENSVYVMDFIYKLVYIWNIYIYMCVCVFNMKHTHIYGNDTKFTSEN